MCQGGRGKNVSEGKLKNVSEGKLKHIFTDNHSMLLGAYYNYCNIDEIIY